jgi:hypothetical protein
MERSQPLFERFRRLAKPVAIIAMAGAIAGGIKHCAAPIPESAGNTSSARYDHGLISGGTNIRTAPERTESQSDTDSNTCAQTTEAIPFSADITIDESPHDPNGPWIGIPIEALPQDIQEDCSGKADDLVWVADEYVNEG